VQPCPILYYIHGGGWQYDSPRMYSPDVLLDNFVASGLVVVTVSYRLGSFGFWYLGDDDASGNYGITGLVNVRIDVHIV
jgi:carboxylesterase type B